MENKIELKLQAECNTWFQNNMTRHRGMFRRVKNETDLKGQQGMRMGQLNKATGVRRGTWDSFFICEPITWLEFKTDEGTLSDDQKEFRIMGKKVGWQFRIVRDLETFQNLCYEIFG